MVVVVGIDIVPHNNESRILISEFFILQPPPDTCNKEESSLVTKCVCVCVCVCVCENSVPLMLLLNSAMNT